MKGGIYGTKYLFNSHIITTADWMSTGEGTGERVIQYNLRLGKIVWIKRKAKCRVSMSDGSPSLRGRAWRKSLSAGAATPSAITVRLEGTPLTEQATVRAEEREPRDEPGVRKGPGEIVCNASIKENPGRRLL